MLAKRFANKLESGVLAVAGAMSLRTAAVSFVVVVVLAILSAAAKGVLDSRQAHLGHAQQNTANLTRALTEQTVRYMGAVDEQLLRVLAHIDDGMPLASADLQRSLADIAIGGARIAVVGREGKFVLHSSGPVNIGLDLSDREFFIALREKRDLGLFLGTPVHSRVDGSWGFHLARRISGPDGEFRGIVVAILQANYFEKLYSAVQLGAAGAIGLFRTDGVLLARHPYHEGAIGGSFAHSRTFKAMGADVEQGSLVTRSAIDDAPRIASYRRVAGYPLVVVASLDEAPVLAGWRREAFASASLAAAASLIAVLLLLLLLRHARSHEKLAASEERLRFAMKAARMFAFERDLKTDHVVRVGAHELLGIGDGDPDVFLAGVHPDDQRRVRSAFANATVRSRGALDVEFRYIMPDGLVAWFAAKGRLVSNQRTGDRRFAGVIIDITERRAVADRSRRYEEQLRALAGASLNINLICDLDTLMRTAVEEARHIIGAHLAVISAPQDENWTELNHVASFSEKYARFGSYDAKPNGSGIYAEVRRTNRPMRLTQAELEAHSMWRNFSGHARKHPPLRGWLAAPLVAKDGSNLGLIQLSDRYEGDFTAEDEAILVQLAQLIGVAIGEAQTKQALRQSEERLRLALEAGRMYAWERDLASAHVLRSGNAEKILGFGSGTIEQFHDHLHPEDRPRVIEAYASAIRTGVPFELDFRFVRPDGRVRWLAERGDAIQSSSAGSGRIAGVTYDVTERKELQISLRQSQTELLQLHGRLTDAMESLPDGFAIFDAEDRLVAWNKAFDDFHADVFDSRQPLTFTELIKSAVAEVIHPETTGGDPDAWTRWRLGRHFNPKAPIEVHYRDGRWAQVAENRTREGGIVLVRTDITELKQKQKALEETVRTNALLAAAIEATTSGITVVDARERGHPIIFCNAGFSALTGYNANEAIGRNCRFLQGPDSDPATVAAIRAAITQAREITAEILNYRKDRTPFWNSLRISPIIGQSGDVEYFIGIQNDVTERRAAEDELRQAQKMDAIGQLSGGIAHDFNNLLTVMLGNTELLVEELEADETNRQFAEVVLRAAERGADLTQRLLAFGRRQPLKPSLTNANAVVGNTLKLLQRTLGKRISIDAKTPPGLWPIIVDQAQLENALLNLALNGRDAMPDGGFITIRTENLGKARAQKCSGELSARDYVMISVSDTGTGISAELKERVFEPFFTTKQPGKGTGLGLSSVFGFVKQSGGHVLLESELGQGTTVKLLFPRQLGTCRDAQQRPSILSPVIDERILLVEDDASVRRTVATMLSSLGYGLLEAEDAEAAIKILASDETIDLLLTDVVMPGPMSGWELAIEGRRLRPDLKTLLVTGYSEEAVAAQQAGETGGPDVLRKPFRKEELSIMLRRALGDRSASRQGA